MLDAELAGWDPATSLAVLRIAGLGLEPPGLSPEPARVGHLALAVGRSWSNAVTASAGIVSIIGGPLATGPHRAIEEVLRTTAPMHDGFAGGAFLDAAGRLLGMTTAAQIRGLGVVIPSRIVWKTASAVLAMGRPQRGYLGLAGQPVRLPEAQRGPDGQEQALLIVSLTPGGPAEGGGLLVGDILLEFDGHAVVSPEELLDLLTGDRVGGGVAIRVRRGAAIVDLTVRVGERPAR